MIAANNLYKSYGSIKAVENVSVSVERGSSLCIQGRSGCGKTTLLKLLALLLPPDKGEIILNGETVTWSKGSELLKSRTGIGYSFQEPLLLPYLTTLENITRIIAPVVSRPVSDVRATARKVLLNIGLSNRLEHYPSKLSVGEKKRVDLARAIVKNASLVIADEPFSNLDPETSDAVREALRNYLDNGGTLIYSSTNPSDSKFAENHYKMKS